MIIPNDTDSYNNLIKYKRLIRKPCISVLAWSKNNFDSSLMNYYTEHNELEKKVINIMSWLDNNSNPPIEKVNELRQRIGSFKDAVNNLCVHLSDVKAKELYEFKGKITDNAFYYCDNIEGGGSVKRTTTLELPQPVLEHQAYLDTGISAEEEE